MMYNSKHLIFLLSITISLLFGCNANKDKPEEISTEVTDTWYRNALIYNLDVDAFKDSDADGTGDFQGLTQKLDYLKQIGVDIIWLSPFQPTPNKDDGYDVTDYFAIDPRVGNEEDFTNFVKEAKGKGFKIIMDVVLNHTSIEHPWYTAARADTTSKYHSWYVWSKERPKDWDKGMVFPGTQNETWTYDEIAKKYYFHRFYDFQPDLNYQNKDVFAKSIEILKYWLNKGVDGFRLDAVPFIIDIPESGVDNPAHMFDILTKMRNEVKKVNPEAVLLGEANVTAEENVDYFGEKGERLQMMFNFFVNQNLFYSLAKQDPEVFEQALEDFRQKPASAQWAFFLRNHDEVDLDRLTNKQRKLVYEKFGPETNMQLYDRGIRRRLATMLGNERHVRMAYNLLFSLPGAPVMRYGEELGMGDDLTLQERLSVRTPMQWSSDPNGGFSASKKTFRPVISLGDYGYPKLNVADQLKDPNSLLNYIINLVNVREKHPEIGLGKWTILPSDEKQLFIIRYDYQNKILIAVHNFGNQRVSSELKLDGNRQFRSIFNKSNQLNTGKSLQIKLEGYGSEWYSINNQVSSAEN